MQRLRETDPQKVPGPIIIWAACKTFGELKVNEAVPLLAVYLTARKSPEISIGPDGEVVDIQLGRPWDDAAVADLGFLFENPKPGAVPKAADMKDWQTLTDEQAAKVRTMLDVFRYPDYVRWTAGLALGDIGGADSASLLRQAEKEESDFLSVLAEVKAQKSYSRQANVIAGLITQHEDVLFYIREALQGLGRKA
jgi:hypothetical protein